MDAMEQQRRARRAFTDECKVISWQDLDAIPNFTPHAQVGRGGQGIACRWDSPSAMATRSTVGSRARHAEDRERVVVEAVDEPATQGLERARPAVEGGDEDAEAIRGIRVAAKAHRLAGQPERSAVDRESLGVVPEQMRQRDTVRDRTKAVEVHRTDRHDGSLFPSSSACPPTLSMHVVEIASCRA